MPAENVLDETSRIVAALESKYGCGTVTLFLRRTTSEKGFFRENAGRYQAASQLHDTCAEQEQEYEFILHAGRKHETSTTNRSEAFALLNDIHKGPLHIIVPYDDKLDTRCNCPYIIREPLEEIRLKVSHRAPQNVSVDSRKSPLSNPLLGRRETVLRAVSEIQHLMCMGECYLMNYTTRCPSPLTAADFSVEGFLSIWMQQPSRFGAFFNTSQLSILCLSPERFVTISGRTIACEPIKGTLRARDGNHPTQEDAERLWAIKKEIFEQTLVVDLVRHDLNGICLPGSVEVRNPFFAAVAGPLLQMQSTIAGTLARPNSLGSNLEAILPVASVTGTPKRRVTELTRKFEANNRSYYTGTFGIRTADGDFDSTVLIRTHFRDGDSTYLGVGGGITTLSDPDSEFNELVDKYRSFSARKPESEQT